MMPPFEVRHTFVEFMPKEREEGVLYVSIPYAASVHNCVCWCRTKVVTTISPVGWELGFDGETVSLAPSVGNWSFSCRSHYIIRRDTVIWAGEMSEEKIASGRARHRLAREAHFGVKPLADADQAPAKRAAKRGILSWLLGS